MQIGSKLYDVASDGSIKEWQIAVEGSTIITIHGKQGMQAITTSKEIKAGKNIGRSNETTPHQQAEMEAASTYQKKLDKGYVTDLAHATVKAPELLPMLAHTYTKRGHDIVLPAYTQPKYNGVRCLAHKISDTEIRYTSRMGKEFTTVNHLTETLLGMLVIGQIFDGELYVHDWSFQRIISAVKKQRKDSTLLQFWVYDTIHQDKPRTHYFMRLAQLNYLAWPCPVMQVPTDEVRSVGGIKQAHDRYVADGYEGVIIRNTGGVYTLKHRSKDLQKHKEFIDEEFEIIGGFAGTGTEEGCVNYIVSNPQGKTPEAKTFKVRPKGTLAGRRQAMKDLSQAIKKMLTVRYQELSEDGVPIFPVGIAIRDYE